MELMHNISMIGMGVCLFAFAVVIFIDAWEEGGKPPDEQRKKRR